MTGKFKSFIDSHIKKYDVITLSPPFSDIVDTAKIEVKNLLKSTIVKCKSVKSKPQFLIVVLPSHEQVDLDLLAHELKMEKQSLLFADESEILNLFPDCEVEAIPPIKGFYDLNTYIDETALKIDGEIIFNTGTYTELVRIPFSEYEKIRPSLQVRCTKAINTEPYASPINTITEIKAYLNENNVHFTFINYSQNYQNEEILKSQDIPQRAYAKVAILNVDGNNKMVLLSVNHRISYKGLKDIFPSNYIHVLNNHEIEELIPQYKSAAIPPFGHLFQLPVIMDKALVDESQGKTITFHLFSYFHLLRIDFSDFYQLVKPEVLNIPKTSLYRVGLKTIVPEKYRNNLDQVKRCFLPVCMKNRNYEGPRFEATVEWIAENFSECHILITDWIYRLTLKCNDPAIDDQTALHHALFRGYEFYKNERPVFQRYSDQVKFSYVYASDLVKTEDYILFHKKMEKLFIDNKDFNESTQTFARTYILRHTDNPDAPQYKKDLKISCDYILEEMALFSCLIKQGWPSMIYAGELTPLNNITEGYYPDAPEELQSLINISLMIRRHKKVQSLFAR